MSPFLFGAKRLHDATLMCGVSVESSVQLKQLQLIRKMISEVNTVKCRLKNSGYFLSHLKVVNIDA